MKLSGGVMASSCAGWMAPDSAKPGATGAACRRDAGSPKPAVNHNVAIVLLFLLAAR
jgi:hypothetical protein